MRWKSLLFTLPLSFLLLGCNQPLVDQSDAIEMNAPSISSTDFSSDLDSAQETLITFFNELSQGDFNVAAKYYVVPNPLMFLYTDIDAENGEDLLERACTDEGESGCVFYCWKIKDVLSRTQGSSDEFIFSVQFADEGGNVLTGGDNVTPRVCDPSGCTHSEYSYVVIKSEDIFLVDGIPVFSGCWP